MPAALIAWASVADAYLGVLQEASRQGAVGYEVSAAAIQRLDALAVELQAQLQQAHSMSHAPAAPGYRAPLYSPHSCMLTVLWAS